MLNLNSWILASLLLVATFSQISETTLGISNSTNTQISEQGIDSSIKGRTTPTDAEKNISFLKDTNQGGAKWVYPLDPTTKLPKPWPIGHWVKYTFCICTDCPQNLATIYVGASSYFEVYYSNGTFIGSREGGMVMYVFNFIKLQCGCKNTFIIKVFNKNIWSPLSVWYHFSQSTTNCYNCENLGMAYYNRDTCKCDCVNPCICGPGLTWYNYPKCACTCPSINVSCPENRFYNLKTCKCECKKYCCPKGTYQSMTSCNCVPGFPSSSTTATLSVDEEEPCVEEQCIEPFVWKKDSCGCDI